MPKLPSSKLQVITKQRPEVDEEEQRETRSERSKRIAKDAQARLSAGANYSDAVQMRLTNLMYDPLTVALVKETGMNDEVNLLGLTRINSSREAFYWAAQITKGSARLRLVQLCEQTREPDCDLGVNERHWSLRKIFRVAFLIARRSIDMVAFKEGNKLAMEQQITKSEDTGEAEDM